MSWNYPLWTVLFTMERVVWRQEAHQASWAHMLNSLEPMAPTTFSWSEELFPMFKDQLTKFRQGESKQFVYRTILACLFFQRVPLPRSQVVFTKIRARYPHILWCVEIMARIGGGGTKVKFEAPFFHWLDDQILMIEDYAYVGTEFRGDPNLPLPLGS